MADRVLVDDVPAPAPSIEPVPDDVPARSRFRPDIEGLRAVAVTLVVLYHAGVPWLAGGYVGVDVFFVVSGFLITGLLVNELGGSRGLSLRAFYARRMRRLLPASALVLIVTVALVKLLLPPLASVGLRGDASATALYVSNVHFAIDGTAYLADTAPSPLLHYWSLAVEEQFYLCWPLLLLVASKLRRGSLARRLGMVVGVVGVASFVLCVVLTRTNQPYAFFLLPARAWELAAGAALALSIDRWRRLPARLAAPLAWAGLAGVVVAAIAYDSRTQFPGWAALAPVVATAAVIAGGATRTPRGPDLVLARRPFVLVGRWSYSLYLWHWPVLVIPASYRVTPLSPWARAGLVALSVVLAAITYALVEDRLRNLPALVRSHGRSFVLGGTLTAAALVAGLLGGVLPRLDAGRPADASEAATTYVPSNLRPSLRGAFDDLPRTWTNGCHADLSVTTVKPCVFGDPDGDRTVVLFGDSHAAHWFPAFEAAARASGWRLVSMTKSACPAAAVRQWRNELGRPYRECDQWRSAAIDAIDREHDPIVVMTGSRDSQIDLPKADRNAEWVRGYEATIAELPDDAVPVILGDTPRAKVNLPVCLSGHLHDTEACAIDRDVAVDGAFSAAQRDAAAATGATFVDPTRWICPSFPCAVIRGDLLVYRDDHHLATPFSASLAVRIQDALAGL